MRRISHASRKVPSAHCCRKFSMNFVESCSQAANIQLVINAAGRRMLWTKPVHLCSMINTRNFELVYRAAKTSHEIGLSKTTLSHTTVFTESARSLPVAARASDRVWKFSNHCSRDHHYLRACCPCHAPAMATAGSSGPLTCRPRGPRVGSNRGRERAPV